MKIRYLLYTLLIASNMLCLSISIELLSFTKMVSYFVVYNEDLIGPKYASVILFTTSVGNLLFIGTTMMDTFVLPNSSSKL